MLTNEIIHQTYNVSKGIDSKHILNIGYLKGYTSQQFLDTISNFIAKFPDIAINVINGNYEELYNLLRTNPDEIQSRL